METQIETPTDDLGPFTEVPIDEPVATVATQGLAPETVNVAEVMSEEDLKKCGERVCRDFDRDWDSSKDYRLRRDSILKLFLGHLPSPVDGEELAHAQVHYPIIAKAVQRIHARIYDQQFPSNGEFFGVKPTDAEDLDRALRVAKHLNWQINHQIPEYVPNHDVLIMQWLLYGSAFSYMYWDHEKNRPCHEVCRTEDIVLPYKRSSTDPSLADMPRITRVLRKYRHEMEEMEDGGYFIGVSKLFEELDEKDETAGVDHSADAESDHPIQRTTDQESGVKKPENDPDAPRELLEQHRWYKLPGEKRQKAVVITVDRQTKRVLCLKLRYDDDPQDKARYNREKAAYRAAYEAAMQQYEMDLTMYEAGMAQSMTMPPMAGEMTGTPSPMPGETTSTGPMMPPPQPPPAPPEPTPPKQVAINFFTHYVCIPNPEGVYGFGVGSELEGNNMAADTLTSQIVDAATLANTVGGFISRQFKASRGDLRFRPGEFIETDAMAQDLDKMIKIIQFPGPEPAMGQLVKDQKQEAEELSGAGDILSGEVGGSNETATTTQIRISQAMQAIAIWNKRYTRARTEEGKKLARLDSVYLGDTEYFTVVDPFKNVPGSMPQMAPPIMGGPGVPPVGAPPAPPPTPGLPSLVPPPPPPEIEKVEVGRMDYLHDTDITVTADPRMASQPQRFQEASTIMNVVNSTPLLASMPPVVIAAARILFKAIDNTEMTAALAQGIAMGPMMAPGPGGPPPGGPDKGGGGPPQPEDPGVTVPNAGPTPANDSGAGAVA